MAFFDLDIGFGANGQSRDYIVSGWSDVEQNETWSVNGRSTLRLPAPAAPAAQYLLMQVRPYIVPGKIDAQRMVVSVNGETLGALELVRPAARAVRIPWRLIEGRPFLEVTFDLPDAARPTGFGGSDDRALGIAFSRVSLFADSAGAASAVEADRMKPVAVDLDRIVAADRIPVQDLMLRFESLGQNCEFGLVQRRCGAEPLGLLRFSSTPLPNLLTALAARFEGMGHPDTVRVEHSSNGREFMINDSRFGFLYHAFVEAGAMDVAALHKRETRRVPFLVRKLIEDLEAAEKIFVFKAMGALEEERVFPLAALLRRYGPNRLLALTLADETHPAGTVELRQPGFMMGYVDRFAPSEDAKAFDLSQWVRVCRAAYRLALAQPAA